MLLIFVSGVGFGPPRAAAAEGDRKPVQAVPAHGSDFAEGVAKWANGDPDGAVASLTKAIQENPRDADRLLARGLLYYDKRDLAKAIADFTGVLNVRKGDPRALRGRARAFCEKGQLAEAVLNVNAVLAARPDDAGALCIRGLILYQRDKLGDALEAFDRAARTDPKNGEALFHRGRIRYGAASSSRRSRTLPPPWPSTRRIPRPCGCAVTRITSKVASTRHWPTSRKRSGSIPRTPTHGSRGDWCITTGMTWARR